MHNAHTSDENASNPRISIVTISYNQVQYLERSLKSVINQKSKQVEFIVLDPGSTDGSREIIRKYSDKIDKIIFEPDLGPADALNKGFALARGNIFGFLNSDDVFYPGALSTISSYFSENPEVDVVSGHCFIIDAYDRKVRRMISDKFNLRAVAYRSCYLAQAATFFRRRKFLKTRGFNIENRVAWDGEMWVDLAMAGAKFAVINEILAGYRIHPASITSAGSDHRQLAYARFIFEKIMQRTENKPDWLFRVVYRLRRVVTNPRAYMETIVRGPINR